MTEQEMNLRQCAEAYTPKETLNIADFDEVSIDVKIEKRVCKAGTPEEFDMMVALVNNKEYRVPWTVLKQVKEMLVHPKTKTMKKFSVLKSGEGRTGTKYSVLPLGL